MSVVIKKLNYIDAVRGAAVLMVLLVHTLTFLDRGGLNNIFRVIVEQGRMGVQLFYIASAFTLFYSLSQREVDKDLKIENTKILNTSLEKYPKLNFFIRRYFRIAPMFYTAVAYYFWQYTTYPVANIEAADLSLFTISNILTHFTFTFGVSPYWINTIVPGGWSVGVEMIFYLLLPTFYFLYKKYGVQFLYKSLAGSVLLSWIFNFTIYNMLYAVSGDTIPKYWHAFLYYNFFTHLPIFILGMIVYDKIINHNTQLKSVWESFKNIHIIFICSIILFLASLYLNKITYEGTFAGSLLFLSVLLAYFVIFLSRKHASKIGRLLVNKFFVYVGKISYSMYLTHFAAIYILSHISTKLFPETNEVTYVLSYIILVILTICISSITYKYIEKPGIIMGNKLIEKLNRSIN